MNWINHLFQCGGHHMRLMQRLHWWRITSWYVTRHQHLEAPPLTSPRDPYRSSWHIASWLTTTTCSIVARTMQPQRPRARNAVLTCYY